MDIVINHQRTRLPDLDQVRSALLLHRPDELEVTYASPRESRRFTAVECFLRDLGWMPEIHSRTGELCRVGFRCRASAILRSTALVGVA